MLINTRHQKILDIVREHVTIPTQKLAEMLYVSSATIRRDIAYLDSRGLIKRSHGFVTSIYSTQTEFTNFLRVQKQVPEKKKIAEKCFEFLKNDCTYFLDSSTTVSYIIPYFSKLKGLTIITNGLDTAQQLSALTQFNLFLTCGSISYSTNSTIGSDTVDYINKFNSHIFLFSCNAISVEGGITETNYEQMRTKTAMLKKSKTTILVADHTKFGKLASFKTCDFSDIDILITDKAPTKNFIKASEENNVKLVIAD